MSAFGIKGYLASSNPEYFVGEEEELWEWVHADNGTPLSLHNKQLVPAPPGYKALRHGDGDEKTEVDGFMISQNSSKNDKGYILLEVLKAVEEAEFAALNLSEDRMITIYV